MHAARANPLPFRLIPTNDPFSFRAQLPGTIEVPLLPHPGAFGSQGVGRVHQGVDLHCATGTSVSAMEAGQVVAIHPMAGAHAASPWWLNTWIVFVQGADDVFAYGHLQPQVTVGEQVVAGTFLGQIIPVYRFSKDGRSTSLLHLEKYTGGLTQRQLWRTGEARPVVLLDPTPDLLAIAGVGGPRP